MIRVLFVLLMLLGLFFVSLGLLFINYDISPLKKIVDREYVYNDNRLGFQVMLPGLILMLISSWLFMNY
ncbi:hypothetical protein [Paramaledivibacter caminithermalis]|jgi:hypothetical protein|uniref:Uncharacterized protein n=1 Tax=Paramaledivibacter caminithermalis (strain DSM 15212 / CIP 107654 / DViRD3) TaxID=1121301 RepID=A0A1M6QPI8_PARC5|nr:hypothetical protein [Paramaledivibacter caminithermalis]SHK22085.1 hypothetical protein SAMN02745912_02657 [Paramaledivibacter caminithermalis DSM 15212]